MNRKKGADSWYNLSDQLCRIDQAMGYYPENESIKPYSTTQKEPENENSIINASYDEQAALVNTQINDLVLLSQRQLTIDELLKVLPDYRMIATHCLISTFRGSCKRD